MRDLRDHNHQDDQAGQNEESPLLDHSNVKTQSSTAESCFVPLQLKLNDPARKRVQGLRQAREESRAGTTITTNQKPDERGGENDQEEEQQQQQREPLLSQRPLHDNDKPRPELILGPIHTPPNPLQQLERPNRNRDTLSPPRGSGTQNGTSASYSSFPPLS
ncbi:hypothetical protein D0869_03770 [Hortaea werneckii]|uniref:Uncharacterized protein n=1 Tax=Hortaea werneckii TaxID=91943 RepID=A0A3M6X3R7_HORWE|nr:hypothetical protein KC324_g8199 [Hortaea werneckii]KAI7583241.1 hypothetical protein KC316_g7397 [Hortaea werneckii]RMX85513.1 hypothetical protein D0869_03770 [Hortaea werneckii]